MHRACLVGADAADHVCAVLDGLLGVECSLLAGEALAYHLGALANKHIHDCRVVARR